MSEQTIHHLVFDKVQIRKYRPGQLICRMSKRSILNKDVYGKFYRGNKSSVQEQLEQAKITNMVRAEHKEHSESVISGFVRSLTAKKPT